MEFKNQKILRLPEINHFTSCIFMFKIENNLLPPCLNDLFSHNRDFQHNTRNRDKLRQPKFHSKIAERFISNLGPKYWNNLDGKIDKSTSLASLKKM